MTMHHRASERATVFRPRHGSRGLTHKVLQGFMMTVAAVAGFTIVAFATTVINVDSALNVRDIQAIAPLVEAAPVDPDDPLAGSPVNILILGSDIRDGENVELGGGADVGGMRSDATVIMHISADRSRIELVSIPRDMRVDIPDCEMFDGEVVTGWTDKFNVAFSIGAENDDPAEAAACTIKTVTEMTGIQINHYVVMDFAGFRDMIDALGGVPMCVPHRMYSSKANLNLEEGPQVLDGTTALAFARARIGQGLGDGSDLQRIDRQQELMANTMEKALGLNLLTDAGALTGFMRAVAESLTLDPTLGDLGYLGGLGFSLRNIDPDNIVFETVPWGSPGDGSGDVVMAADAEPMFANIVADRPIRPEETASPDPEDAPIPNAPLTSTVANVTTEVSAGPTASTEDLEREAEEEILSACE